MRTRICTLAALVMLAGCSKVGPGFANHPLDCAIGIAWGDCLPGTPGYASLQNGGNVNNQLGAVLGAAALSRSYQPAPVYQIPIPAPAPAPVRIQPFSCFANNGIMTCY